MKKLILISIITVVFQYASAQIGESRSIGSFNSIVISNTSKIILQKDTIQSIQLENENPAVKTVVSGNTLNISGASSKMIIHLAELKSLDISRSANISSDSTFSSEKLEINISGNGKVILPVNVNQLNVDVSGMGKVTLSGNANQLEINISGDAKIAAENLKVKKCETNISGVGKCSVDVLDDLSLNISGTGAFYYLTKPLKIDSQISGIGKYGMINEANGDDTTKTISSHGSVVTGENEKGEFNFSIADSIFHRHEKARSHWGGLDLGFNQLMTGKSFSTTLADKDSYLDLNSGKSINVNINIFYHDFPLYKRYLIFTTGIGLTIDNFRFNSDKTLRSDTNRVAVDFDYDKNGKQISYEKNKLLVAYYSIPLLLQYNSNEELKKSFHIAAGLLCSYKFNSHLKLVYTVDGTREKEKRHDDYNINPFRTDATIRLGYSYYTVYASYSLIELFKSNRGPEVHPFQVGINLGGW